MSGVEREGCVYSNYSKMPNLGQSLCALAGGVTVGSCDRRASDEEEP